MTLRSKERRAGPCVGADRPLKAQSGLKGDLCQESRLVGLGDRRVGGHIRSEGSPSLRSRYLPKMRRSCGLCAQRVLRSFGSLVLMPVVCRSCSSLLLVMLGFCWPRWQCWPVAVQWLHACADVWFDGLPTGAGAQLECELLPRRQLGRSPRHHEHESHFPLPAAGVCGCESVFASACRLF